MNRDPYSRSEYRQLIAWKARILRERPFLLGLLDRAPDRSVLDVGCGTGEHTAFFAENGARSIGLDRSETMIEKARDHEARGAGRFVLGDAVSARTALGGEAPFGLAICLGNMLPHILEWRHLESLVREVRALLAPGGMLLIQILNYQKILSQGIRSLPVNFRSSPDDADEIVFLRLLKPLNAERLIFYPTTLLLSPDEEEPLSVVTTRRVELRPWTDRDLVPFLEREGFDVVCHGDMEGGGYESEESADLVVIATRASGDGTDSSV